MELTRGFLAEDLKPIPFGQSNYRTAKWRYSMSSANSRTQRRQTRGWCGYTMLPSAQCESGRPHVAVARSASKFPAPTFCFNGRSSSFSTLARAGMLSLRWPAHWKRALQRGATSCTAWTPRLWTEVLAWRREARCEAVGNATDSGHAT